MIAGISTKVQLQEVLAENKFLRNRLHSMAQVAEDLVIENEALKRSVAVDDSATEDEHSVE